jgi:hypothetical protein
MYVPHHDHPIAIDQRQFLSGPSWNYYPALACSVLLVRKNVWMTQ